MDSLSPAELTSVTVVGAGSMGHGIAQVFATAGYEVTLVDISEELLVSATENIRRSLERLGEDSASVLDRIETTTDRAAGLRGADVMVEAVPEDIDIKEDVFEAADELLPEHAILATNTSTLPITEIAAATDRPERVVGMHFSNPVPLIELVEVVRGEKTDDEIAAVTISLSEALGKTPVLVKKDVPGFLLNRINYAFWSEALRSHDQNGLDTEAIDASIRRLGFPMGPFEVLDFAGVDVFYLVCQSMRDRGVPVRISETHEELFETERHGMKSGAGFYDYPEAGAYARVDIPPERRYEYDPYRMIAAAVNAAAWLLEAEVTTRDDVDKAMRIGMSWPRGPFELADEYGIDRIVEMLERLHGECGWEQYEPNRLLKRMVADGSVGIKSGDGFYDYADEHHRETYGTVEYERRGFYALITLSRPDRDNALDEAAWSGLEAALEHARDSDTVRATILRGAGDAFCTGVDADEIKEREDVDDVSTYFEEMVDPVIDSLHTHPKPVISLVDGVATGVGCELVLLSDMAIASERSRFGRPETDIGGDSPNWIARGATSVGKKKTMELAMTGNRFPANEAASFGLVNYAVSADQAADVARELARSTTASSPEALESVKRIWNDVEKDLGYRSPPTN